jgi:hypothetical protein
MYILYAVVHCHSHMDELEATCNLSDDYVKVYICVNCSRMSWVRITLEGGASLLPTPHAQGRTGSIVENCSVTRP